MSNKENGFTLIEVLIAVAVLSFGILALETMQSMAIKETGNAGDITSKSMFAASQIEQILNLSYNDPLLDDTDGDGTNQDPDADGRDNDDDGNVNLTGLNEEFGLRQSECCLGAGGALVDPRGNLVPGCVEVADHCDVYEGYEIYWNVAVDHPVTNTKTITIIVINPRDKVGQAAGQTNRSANRAEYTYCKDDVI